MPEKHKSFQEELIAHHIQFAILFLENLFKFPKESKKRKLLLILEGEY